MQVEELNAYVNSATSSDISDRGDSIMSLGNDLYVSNESVNQPESNGENEILRNEIKDQNNEHNGKEITGKELDGDIQHVCEPKKNKSKPLPHQQNQQQQQAQQQQEQYQQKQHQAQQQQEKYHQQQEKQQQRQYLQKRHQHHQQLQQQRTQQQYQQKQQQHQYQQQQKQRQQHHQYQQQQQRQYLQKWYPHHQQLKQQPTQQQQQPEPSNTQNKDKEKIETMVSKHNTSYNKQHPHSSVMYPKKNADSLHYNVKTHVAVKGLLTRRGVAGDHYAHSAANNRNKQVRGDSRLSNYERSIGQTNEQRFYNARYSNGYGSAPLHPSDHVTRERVSDKVVTFYRSFNSTQAEFKFVISRVKHPTLVDVMDDLSRKIFLSDRERFVHTSHGTIINDVLDFTDGGIYFFGPPHMFDMNDYNHFQMTNTPPHSVTKNGETTDREKKQPLPRRASRLSNQSYDNPSDNGSNIEKKQPLPRRASRLSNQSYDNRSDNGSNINQFKPIKSLQKRKRFIKVILNMDMSTTCSFMVDESRHFSVLQIIDEISEQMILRHNRIERICTRKGKIIQKVEEFYQGTDDHFYAYLPNSYPPPEMDPYAQYAYNGNRSYNMSINNGGRVMHNSHLYDRQFQKPVKVDIMNNAHTFDPPSTDYFDPTNRRGRDFQEELQLEWVYGYNGKNCRNNIYLLPSEELLYFVAKVVVIYNEQAQQQRFYTEHSDEIRSVAQHPNMWMFATGQVSKGTGTELGHVRIWDSKILVTLNVLQFDEPNLSIECMDFCGGDNGIRLATVGVHNEEWYLTVWDWEESIKLSTSDPYFVVELQCQFDPNDKNTLVTCGKQHVFFWDVSRDDAVYEIGNFNDQETPDYVTCIDFTEDDMLVSADSNGYIHLWDNRVKKTTSIINTTHTGSIITMKVLPGECIITGGGADRKLSLISYNALVPTQAEIELPEVYGGVVSIVPLINGFRGSQEDYDFMKIVIGTSSNSILFGALSEQFECMIKGSADELSGMSVHPNENIFISAGADSMVTMWSTDTRSEVWEVKLDQPCSAVDFNPTGDIVVIGTSSGRWFVHNTNDGTQITSFQCDRSRITFISYSPGADMLAVGMESGSVFLYNCYEECTNYRFYTSCKASQDEIEAIDWSTDGALIRFVNIKYDLFHFNVESRRIEGNRNILRDVEYDSENAPMSYQTAGVWLDAGKELLYKASDRSHGSTMFIAGANSGAIRLYHYPCDLPTVTHISKIENNPTPYHEVNIHSTEVSKVGFLGNDRCVLSSGLNDYCIAQWKVVRKIPTKIEDRRYSHRYPGLTIESMGGSVNMSGSQRFGPSPRIKEGDSGSLTKPRLTNRSSVLSGSVAAQEYIMRQSTEGNGK